MQSLITPSRHALTLGAAVVTVALGLSAIALADGAATDSKTKKAKIKCPRKVTSGRKVTCKVVGQAAEGPQGLEGRHRCHGYARVHGLARAERRRGGE